MSEYISIKESVLKKIEDNLTEIRERFGVEKISLFGSVSRGEDSLSSDVDIIVTFLSEYDKYMNFINFSEYLESLIGRHVDLLTERSLDKSIRPYVMAELITVTDSGSTA